MFTVPRGLGSSRVGDPDFGHAYDLHLQSTVTAKATRGTQFQRESDGEDGFSGLPNHWNTGGGPRKVHGA
ncbi:hypothetical protein VTG60DRAFT_5494 [Thermothelomyces hinnuleus]